MRFRSSASLACVTLCLTSACSGSLADLNDPVVAAFEQSPAPTLLAAASPTTTTAPSTTTTEKPVESEATTPATTALTRSTTAAAPAQPDERGEPLAIYRGYLGTLDPGDIVAPVPDFIPATTPGHLPLLGIEGTPAHPQPVLVKVDNSSRAVPQSGLNDADLVIEEEVEWGITRFAAVFHSREAVVGPVRSGRTTDLNFLPALGRPAFVYSGANTLTDQLLRRLDAVDNQSAARNGSYWRQSGRRAPSNLFTNTASFRSNDAAPNAFLHYRDPSVPVTGTPSTSLSIAFGSTDARWDWDGSAWVRIQNGKKHLTTGGAQVSAATVIVVWVTKVDTGMVDSAGGIVPELILLGNGPATILIDGQRVTGQWMRASLDAPLTLVDPDGNPIGATPGRAWIELVTQDDIVT